MKFTGTIDLLAVIFCWSLTEASTAHFGDVKLALAPNRSGTRDDDSVTGALLVYYGDDRGNPTWGSVCSENFNEDGGEGSKAICNILGYVSGEFLGGHNREHPELTDETLTINKPVLLTNLDCATPDNGVVPNHLLRCKKYAPFTGSSCVQGSVHLRCSGQKGLPLHDNYHPSKSYRGELELCPPNTFQDDPSYPAVQVSFGLVSVYLHNVWGTLNDNTPLSSPLKSYEADSICRQLGFTQAEARGVRTRSSFEGKHNFSNCYSMKQKSGSTLNKIWLKTDETVDCSLKSAPCFSCCYDRPSEYGDCLPGDCPDSTSCPDGTCSRENDLVISCVFDPTVTPSSGNEGECHYNRDDTSIRSRVDVCPQQEESFNLKQMLAAVLVPTVALIFVISGLTLFVVVYIYRKRRQGYQVVPGGNVRQDNGHGGQHGGGGVNQNGNEN